MIILLPPSETKLRPSASEAPRTAVLADVLERLSFPRLNAARSTMLRALERTAASPSGPDLLGIPASAADLAERMAHVMTEPVAPPLDVYAGVLFEQLDPAITPSVDRRVLVQSALLGIVDAATDLIPAYRVSATSRVSRLGRVAPWWRPRLEAIVPGLLAEAEGSASPLVLDARSGSYRSMMPIRSSKGARVLQVSAVQERAGRRSVVSHDAKRYRGMVVRSLLADPSPLRDAESLAQRVQEAMGDLVTVELTGDELVVVDRLGGLSRRDR